MKTIFLLLLLFPIVALSYDYNVKDNNWNKRFEIRDSVIRDNNWNKLGSIDKDGYIRDNNWNRILKIERKHK